MFSRVDSLTSIPPLAFTHSCIYSFTYYQNYLFHIRWCTNYFRILYNKWNISSYRWFRRGILLIENLATIESVKRVVERSPNFRARYSSVSRKHVEKETRVVHVQLLKHDTVEGRKFRKLGSFRRVRRDVPNPGRCRFVPGPTLRGRELSPQGQTSGTGRVPDLTRRE